MEQAICFTRISPKEQIFLEGADIGKIGRKQKKPEIIQQRNYYIAVVLRDHLQKILIFSHIQKSTQEAEVKTKPLHSKEQKQPAS